jgi:hypothetical protein
MPCFFVLGRTFGLFFHGEDINMVKGHNVGFVVNLKSLTIHHKLITFCRCFRPATYYGEYPK